MRVRITDSIALHNLNPRSVRLYLQTRVWERGVADNEDAWQLPTPEGVYEAVVPFSRRAKDYEQRLAELLRTLSVVENRSEQDIFRDMNTLGFDIQRIRTRHETPEGTAPLRDAVDAFTAAFQMLASAAATVEEPRLVLPSRRSTTTNSLMRRVLAGPTEPGSFIMSIWVPIPPPLTPYEDAVLFDPDGDPAERIATRRLYEALTATRRAGRDVLDDGAGIEAFEERAEFGVSANLCESLVEIGGQSRTPFDVGFSWALSRPMRDAPQDVTFERETLDVLEQAATELRESIPEDEVRVRGSVMRLTRDDPTGAGDVTIAGSVDDGPIDGLRRYTVNLAREDYEAAIEAHRQFSDVEVRGSLVRRGSRSYIQNAHGFRVLPAASP